MISLLLAASVAFAGEFEDTAGEFEDTLAMARDSIVAKEYAQAKELLSTAETMAPNSDEVLKTADVAQIWYLRGVVQHLEGEDPLNDWRQTLVMHLGHPWDAELIPDEGAQDAFIALKSEIQNRPIVSLQVPDKYGQAVIYVDGFIRAPADFAYQGMHLAQIKCPNGEVFGEWTNFEKKMKWVKMCPYKFDVEDMPEPEVEDEWAMFASMGSDDGMTAPEVNMSNEMVAPPVWDRINKPALYAAIGSAAVSGTLYALAMNGKNKFNDLDNEDIQTVEDLDALRSSTNTRAVTSASFGSVAVGLYLAAFWNLKNK